MTNLLQMLMLRYVYNHLFYHKHEHEHATIIHTIFLMRKFKLWNKHKNICFHKKIFQNHQCIPVWQFINAAMHNQFDTFLELCFSML